MNLCDCMCSGCELHNRTEEIELVMTALNHLAADYEPDPKRKDDLAKVLAILKRMA